MNNRREERSPRFTGELLLIRALSGEGFAFSVPPRLSGENLVLPIAAMTRDHGGSSDLPCFILKAHAE
jgi:hypothetical protein